ncbi:hypothetical protein L6E12_31425 [Actinokineospora sp. PR83]|uniref:hypothetical protein n=1 Tax=Actinokineospora sp. PR83 TaxID=2884908 RepID=UPI001F3802B9|nr:hypothetical protein [Actinokineospora sp. PR83]MCG8920290.1 hypothetical protein [Actinokineospora sp. PR83]
MQPEQPVVVTVDPLVVRDGVVSALVVVACLPPPASLVINGVLEILVGDDYWVPQGRNVLLHLLDEPVAQIRLSAPYSAGTWRARVRLGGVDATETDIDLTVTSVPEQPGLAPDED